MAMYHQLYVWGYRPGKKLVPRKCTKYLHHFPRIYIKLFNFFPHHSLADGAFIFTSGRTTHQIFSLFPKDLYQKFHLKIAHDEIVTYIFFPLGGREEGLRNSMLRIFPPFVIFALSFSLAEMVLRFTVIVHPKKSGTHLCTHQVGRVESGLHLESYRVGSSHLPGGNYVWVMLALEGPAAFQCRP